MNIPKLRPFISIIYLIFGIWIICSAIQSYRLIPFKQKYFDFQEVTYRQAHHINMVYKTTKNGGKIDDYDLARVSAYLNQLEQSKKSLLEEIHQFPTELANFKNISDSLYFESVILKQHFDTKFKNWNSEEPLLSKYRAVLNKSINESVDCSISTIDIYRSITGRTAIDDFLEQI